jgi:hypothetical protein
VVLEPGEYEFVVDTTSATRIVTVTSKSTGWSGMILASAIGDTRMSGASSSLTLANSDGAKYVKTLYLNDAGAALEFSVPKAMARLCQSCVTLGEDSLRSQLAREGNEKARPISRACFIR